MAALSFCLRAPRAPAVPPLLAAAFALLVVGLLAADGASRQAETAVRGAPAPAVAPAPPGASATAEAKLPVVDVATTYRVQRRDTLSKVAAVHDVPLESLAAANGLAPPYPLATGQVLHVPAADPAAATPLPRAVAEAPAIEPVIERWAAAYDLPSALLKAVTWRESRWRTDAVSNRGAIGVGQVLPQTAAWVSSELVGTRLDPWRVEDNLHLSAAYLRWLIDRGGGDQAAALAAYHQGRTSVLGKGWYSVTERYVADVFELRWQFEAAARAGQPASA